MSRKARLPIPLSKGIEVKVEGKVVSVKGPKGTLIQEIVDGIRLAIDQDGITVVQEEGHYERTNFLGLCWALINNMVKGVSEGYQKKLEMIGVGYRAAVQGNLLDLQIGLSHPTKINIPKGIEVAVEKNTLIQIKGIDKRLVGQFAADVRAKKPPEPYKGKGIRYIDEHVRRKAGKAGKK
jgi:large subunit ribosomal protein L6